MKLFLVSFLVLFTALPLCLCNLAKDVTKCGDDVALPLEIYVDGCEETPCTVRNGDSVKFELVYSPPRASKNLTANVNLMLGSLAIPYTLSEDDANACNGLIESSCPIEPETPIRYGLALVVEAPITGVTVDLEFFLSDDEEKKSVCFRYSQTIIA